jgi:hypothetical protein
MKLIYLLNEERKGNPGGRLAGRSRVGLGREGLPVVSCSRASCPRFVRSK